MMLLSHRGAAGDPLDVRSSDRCVYNAAGPIAGRAVTTALLLLGLAACSAPSSSPSEIQPGERDYPVTNPHPTDILTIDATIPSTLLVSITAIYLASPTAGGTMDSGMACQRTVGLAVTAPFSLTKAVRLLQRNGIYTASVPIDGLFPGRCEWHFSHMNYSVRAGKNPPDRSDNELAVYQATAAPVARLDIWCLRFPDNQGGVRPEVCSSLGLLNEHFATEIPAAFVEKVEPTERRDGPPLIFGPDTRSLRITFHDLDQQQRR